MMPYLGISIADILDDKLTLSINEIKHIYRYPMQGPPGVPGIYIHVPSTDLLISSVNHFVVSI